MPQKKLNRGREQLNELTGLKRAHTICMSSDQSSHATGLGGAQRIHCFRGGCRYQRNAFRTSRSWRTLHPSTTPATLLSQSPGNNIGGSVPANHAVTAASKYSNTDRPCCVQVAITVQIRSHQRFPFSLLVPCVIKRSITTNRIACSARLLVGSTPGVVMNRK